MGCTSSDNGSNRDRPDVRAVGGHQVQTDLAKRVEEYFASNSADAFRNRRALLVMVGGQVVVERYDKTSAMTNLDVQSVGKSVLSTLIGIALSEHHLRDLDQTVEELLPSYRSLMHAEVKPITLRQLLTMTAGLPPDDVFYPDVFRGGDWVAKIVSQPPVQPPGQDFLYSSAGSHLLSAILREAVGRPVLEYAREKLLSPLEIDTVPAAEPVATLANAAEYDRAAGFGWPIDPQGVHVGGGGQKFKARDMAKLGQLWLNGGRSGGRQLVSKSWIGEATRPAVTTNGAPPEYGYQFWVTTADGHGAFAAIGGGGQLIEVIPDLDLVVVVQSRTHLTEPPDPGAADANVYLEMVANVIAPAVS